jgi:hypothetical protein
MGRGGGKDSWAHAWFSPVGDTNTVQCRFTGDDGVRCTHTTSRRFVNVLAEHARRHGISKTTPVQKSSGTVSIREAMAAFCPVFTKEEVTHIFLAVNGLPQLLLVCPLFRQITATQIARQRHVAALESIHARLRTAAVRHVKDATLALDIGTVQKRYIAFVIISKGRALFWNMVQDEAIGGSFTAAKVKELALETIAELAIAKIRIANCVADNASNLQAIDRDEIAAADPLRDAVRAIVPNMTRCACHVLQLAVNDAAPLWTQAFTICKSLCEQKNVRVRECDTRWNSKLRVMEAAAPFLDQSIRS